ncbi:hypothetical protein ACEUZ9_004553 [Paracoccus litorisediminis]|uniref:hypothetical protein n=1 Tax=Paracoccus litorisediminis TaxID=2006130 RepID=UPI00372E346C
MCRIIASQEISISSMIWLEGFAPEFTENFTSNEVLVIGLNASEVWSFLTTPAPQLIYYQNAADFDEGFRD